MKRWIGLSLLLVPLLVGAASFWDGNAALQRGDAAFEAGAFAASNSFPQDTRILIQNLDTGKTTEATVTKRIDSQSDILVLVSPVAAAALGITQGTMASVRVTVLTPPQATAATKPGEQLYSSDPDVNPGAAYGGPSPAAAEAPQSTEAPQAAEAPAQPDAAAQTSEAPATQQPGPAVENPPSTDAAQPPAVVPASPQDQTAQVAEEQRQAEDAAIIADAQSRTPQKELFLPPREDPKFAYHPQAEPVQQQVASAPEAAPTAQPTPPTTEQPLAEAPTPPESKPQEILGGTTSPQPKAAAGSAPAPLPEAPKPRAAAIVAQAPVQQPAAKPARPLVTPKTTAALPRSTKPGTFYLQLGAYGTEKVAQDLAARLAPTYPALIVSPPDSAGTRVFRVVIGPLNKAESGTLLTWFRYRGFPDAFLKQE